MLESFLICSPSTHLRIPILFRHLLPQDVEDLNSYFSLKIRKLSVYVLGVGIDLIVSWIAVIQLNVGGVVNLGIKSTLVGFG